jgi:hypothetical protein
MRFNVIASRRQYRQNHDMRISRTYLAGSPISSRSRGIEAFVELDLTRHLWISKPGMYCVRTAPFNELAHAVS